MTITLRAAVTVDLIDLKELFVSTILNVCKNDYGEDQIRIWTSSVHKINRWDKLILNQYIQIAEIDKKIVGFGSLDKGNYIDFLYVHKDFTRQGIANKIYTKLKQESIRLGYNKLKSDVSITARPFFENKGFKVIHENKNIIKGVEIINFHMAQ